MTRRTLFATLFGGLFAALFRKKAAVRPTVTVQWPEGHTTSVWRGCAWVPTDYRMVNALRSDGIYSMEKDGLKFHPDKA